LPEECVRPPASGLVFTGNLGYGDVWTWTAICADTKVIASFFVGLRNAGCAYHFMRDLAGRLKNGVQLTTDGHKAYYQLLKMRSGQTSTMRNWWASSQWHAVFSSRMHRNYRQ